jgi:hypothetical protein
MKDFGWQSCLGQAPDPGLCAGTHDPGERREAPSATWAAEGLSDIKHVSLHS